VHDQLTRRIGIVSSVDVSCGNAAFTNVIAGSLAALPGVSVELLPLDLEITQGRSRLERQQAESHIDDLCRRIRTLDAVNIQFERGLYGPDDTSAADRLERLVEASPTTFVTYHAVRTVDPTPVRRSEALSRLAEGRPRAAVSTLRLARASRIQAELSQRFVAAAGSRQRAMIVHTQRSATRIRRLWPTADVRVHPLRIVEPDRPPTTDLIGELRTRLGLPADAVVVGVFGYLGGYKGLDTAIRALKELPSRYHLFVLGRQHPQSIRQGEPINGSVLGPLQLVQQLRLKRRVHFIGELGDDAFVDAAAGVDVAWLPYLEVDQDGSGIAAITFDVARRVIASASFAFDELMKLIPYEGVERFDIGNHLELAQKTVSESDGVRRPPTAYTLQTQAELYLACATRHETGAPRR
jgi:glycosyltransferase involved in cell wall biosynthesis